MMHGPIHIKFEFKRVFSFRSGKPEVSVFFYVPSGAASWLRRKET